MALYALGILVIVGISVLGYFKLWYDTVQLRNEVQRLREAQDTLIDMISAKLIEDDSLDKEFLRLKLERARDDG